MAKRSRKTLEKSSYAKHVELYRCYYRLSSIALHKWLDILENNGWADSEEATEMYETRRRFFKTAIKHWGIAQSVYTRIMNNY